MDTDREANTGKTYPPEFEEDNRRYPPECEEDAVTNTPAEERDGATDETSPTPVRPGSRPDFGSIGCSVLVLAVVLFFVWLIVSAISDVAKESRERENRRRQNLYSYHSSTTKRASSGSSYSGSSSSGSSSKKSSSNGSSGSAYKSGKTGGGNRKDEYNAADFGNPDDFYDEHYDDFFDYYEAEDYWNEHT